MSFAQEMKDFNSSFQSTTKTMDDSAYKKLLGKQAEASTAKITAETPDDEDDALEKQLMKAKIAHVGSGDNQKGALNQLRMQQLQNNIALQKRALQPQVDPTAAALPQSPGNVSPMITPDATAPAAPAIGDQSDASDSLPDQDTNFSATGGLVAKAAGGGAIPQAPSLDASVDDGDDSEDDSDADDATPQSNPATQYSTQAAQDAVAGGLQELHDRFGMTYDRSGAIPGGGANYTSYHRGQGAAPLADMDQIYKKIDPNNQMSDSQRNMAALSAVWQFKLSHGDPEGAKRAAAMMLQHYRLASQRYAAIAAVAGQNGNADLAAKAAMKAYANIPDGKDLQITKDPETGNLHVQYTDANGHLIHGGLMTPQQLGAQAMGVATKGFDQFLMQAAGEKPQKGQQGAVGGANAGQPKGMKPKDKADEAANLGGAADAQFTGPDGDTTQLEQLNKNPEIKRGIIGTAKRISARNGEFTDDESLDLAKRMIMPDPNNPDKTPFTAKKSQDEDGNVSYEVRFGKRLPIKLSGDEYDDIIDRRAELLASIKQKKDKADADAKKPSFLQDMARATREYAGSVETPPGADGEIGYLTDQFNDGERRAGGAPDPTPAPAKQAIPARPVSSRTDDN